MAKAEPRDSWEDSTCVRLASKGFVLHAQERGYTEIGYMVLNEQGDVVFGKYPQPYSATQQDVDNFLKAQEL